jgi:catecholate siderophore receptor
VTKKAEIGQDFNAYSLSLNTFGASEVQFDKNVAIDETSAFRLNAYFNTFENHRDYSDGSGYGVNPTYKFALSDQTTLDVSVEAIDYDRSIDRGIPSGADAKPATEYSHIVFGDPDLNKSEFESLAFRALLQHSFSDTLKGIFTASYTDYDKLYKNFYAKKYNETANDKVTFDGYVDTTKRQNLVLSGNLVAQFEQGDVNHTLLYGAEYLNSSSENDRHTPIYGTAGNELSIAGRNLPNGFNAGGLAVDFTSGSSNSKDDSTSDVDVLSLYVQDEIELSDNLTALLGARYDKYEIDSVNVKKNNEKTDHSESEITPRMGLIYKPQEDVSVYASYSQTFLPASGDQFATVGGGSDFDPNEYTNLEAGVKLNLASGFNVTAAVFQVDADVVEDISATSTKGDYQRFNNEIEGFELQVMRKVSNQWTVSAGYTKLDGDDTNTGKRVAELPKSTFTIWNNFQLSDKLGLGLGAIYQGESSPKGGPGKGIVPSFTRVDAAAYYQLSDNLRLQLNVENLLDEEYYPHAYGDHQFTVGAPLNATVSIKGTF